MGKIIQKRAEQYIKDAKILLAIAFVILAVAGYFGYWKYVNFTSLKAQDKMVSELSQKNQTEKDGLEGVYTTSKTDFMQEIKNRDVKIASIFPSVSEITELTRTLDQFFVDNNFANDPVILNSLVFGSVENSESYNKLRFTINVQGSENNFFRFLSFISDSGNFGKAYRLMSVDSINISFPSYTETPAEDAQNQDGQINQEISFTVQGIAYFQK